MDEPLPPGAEEEDITAPGVEPEGASGAEQAPGAEASADGQGWAASQAPVSGAADYGYQYANYGAQYTDPAYDYQAYYNSYYYPQGQGYGAQPDAASGYYTGYEGYQQPYQQQEAQPEASTTPVSAPAVSAPDQPPGTPTAVPISATPATPSSEAQTLPSAEAAQPQQESFVMGDSVQLVSITEQQRAAAEQQRQALEAARLAAEAQVQRELEERRRREEERLRERNLAAQRAAQAAAAAKPKDTGPTPETLAQIQQKLEEASLLAAKHTAAADEEAAKKEAEANALAKKKPTLQGAKLAFVKPGIMASTKRQDSADAGASPGLVAADSAEKDDKAKQEAHRALIMQRLAAMKAVRAGGSINDAVVPPSQPDSARRRQSSRSPSRSSMSRSPSPPARRRHAKASPGAHPGSPDDSRRRYRGSPVRPQRRDSFQQAPPGRRPDSGSGLGTGRPSYDQQATAADRHPSHGHRDSSRRRSGHGREQYDDYNGHGQQEYADEGDAERKKEKRRKEKRRHRHRRSEQGAEAEYGDACAEEPPRGARPQRIPQPEQASYANYYNDQDQIAAPVDPPFPVQPPRVQPVAAAHVAVPPVPAQPPAFVPQPASLAAPPSKPVPPPATGLPEIKGPPKLAELRARAAGMAGPSAARPGSPSSGSESRSPSPVPPPARPVQQQRAAPQPQARQPAPVQQPAVVQQPPQPYLPPQQYPVQAQHYQQVPPQQYQQVQHAPPQQQYPYAPQPQQQQQQQHHYQNGDAWPGQGADAGQQQGGSGFLPAQVKEAAAAAMARRHAEQQQQAQQQQAAQRVAHVPLQERVSDVPAPSPNYPPPGLRQPQQEGQSGRVRSRRRSVADSYDEYDREYVEQPHAPAHPAAHPDQEGYSSEGGRRHRRQHKKRRKEGGSSKHRQAEPVRERKASHKRSRRRSPTPSASPEPPAARPGSARPNGRSRDHRRPGYFQHDDRATPPAEPARRGSLRSGSRRRRSYSQSRSPSGSRSGSYSRSRSRSPRRARSPSPAAKAAAAAEAEARAQKLAQDVARAAAAARLAADANNSLAATRPARKIYVGSLPMASSEAEITHFFNQMMSAAGAATPLMPGQPVVSCYINHEKRFAFVEFRTVEEASNAMALDGLGYRGEVLRIRRPSDYNSMTMAHLGPTQPSAAVSAGLINLSGLASGATQALPSSGGEQAGAEQQAPAAPPPPAAAPPAPAAVPEASAVQAPPAPPVSHAEPGELPAAAAALPAPAPAAHVVAAGQTKVLRLANMVKREELAKEEEYEDIKDDIYWEIHDKFGAISSIVIPRPAAQPEQDPSGVGLVFLAFEAAGLATAAQAGLHRRKFGDSRTNASLYDQQQFDRGIYE